MFTKTEILRWLFIDGLAESEHTWAETTELFYPDDEGDDTFAATIRDVEDGGTFYTVNAKTIRKGIRVGYKNRDTLGDPYQRKAFRDLNAGKWDDVDYDAFTADYLIQFALFGEVRYS